jgi:hypothetical protein
MIKLRIHGLSWRRIEDEIVVLDQNQSVYFAVNPTGSALWELLHSGADRSTLVRTLADAFGLGLDAAARDVDAFLASLHEQGWLEPFG